ncbi:MAG: hypothetical protein E6I78_09685 [Chloroflexi bacterium]|nr:MAG: hypothetical protein E6I78_09685 [Chloroflexota bacterium]
MADNQRSVETVASPAAVWRVWSDTTTWPQWNPDVQSMTLDGPSRQVQLTEVVPGRSFRLETTVIPLTRFAFECQVVAGAAGKTTISQAIRVGGPLGGVLGGMMGSQIANTFPALLQGLASKAEASEGRT